MKSAPLVIAFLLFASVHVLAQKGGVGGELEHGGLVIRGRITELEVERDKEYVKFYVKLNVEFVNEGQEPIILFKPSVDDRFQLKGRYWLGGYSLFLTEEDAKNWKSIFKDGYWESVIGSDYYRNLAEKLDVKAPPDEYTKILRTKETWEFADNFRISFEAERHTSYPEQRTWKEMQQFPSQLWLRIDYELSPWNVEYFRPDLIRKLRKRWAMFGTALVEKKKEGRYNHLFITSEPMPIDFSQAKPKEQTSTSDKER